MLKRLPLHPHTDPTQEAPADVQQEADNPQHPPEAASDETGPSEDLQSWYERGEKRKGNPTCLIIAPPATPNERQTTQASHFTASLPIDDLEQDTRPAQWAHMTRAQKGNLRKKQELIKLGSKTGDTKHATGEGGGDAGP